MTTDPPYSLQNSVQKSALRPELLQWPDDLGACPWPRGRPRALRPQEVADVWYRPASFVFARIKSGKLPAFELSSKTYRVHWKDALDFNCGVPPMNEEHPDISAARIDLELKTSAKARDELAERKLAEELHRKEYPWLYKVVYFVAAERSRLIKIGFASDIKNRFLSLSRSGPEPLRLVAIMPGTITAERQLHRRYSVERLHGEWFSITPRIVKFVNLLRLKHSLPDWAATDLANGARWKPC